MRTLTTTPTNTLVVRANEYQYIIQSTLRQEGRHTSNTKRMAKELTNIKSELKKRKDAEY